MQSVLGVKAMRLRQNIRYHAENFITHTTESGDRLTQADVTLYMSGKVLHRFPSSLLRVDRVLR